MLVNPSDLVAQAKATIQECSVKEVHDCIGVDTIFIDIRELAEYQRGHIPGAVHADLDQDLADPPGDGGRHPLPDPDKLIAKLGIWGVGDEDQVITYDDSGGSYAARAWWVLRWLGHVRVAVLDGTAHAPGQPWRRGTQAIKTLWGEHAWQLGGASAFDIVAENDVRNGKGM